MPPNFPTVDQNHVVNLAAKDLLGFLRPPTWLTTDRDGDNDYGLDIEVQVAPEGSVEHTFRVQLKGTESPSYSADGTELTIGLKRTTLNFYANTTEPVMFLVAVLKLQSNGKADFAQSKIYWLWISDEIKRIRDSAFGIDESSQGSTTIRVPLSNELNSSLDVVPDLRRGISQARAVETLSSLVNNSSGERTISINPIEYVVDRAKAKPQIFESLLSSEIDSLDRHSEGTPLWIIEEAISFLKLGRTSLAENLIARIDRTPFERSADLKAQLASIEGKIEMQHMRRERARELFEAAYLLHPIEKHLLPREELRLFSAVDESDRSRLERVVAALQSVQSNEGLALLVRAQVALGDFEVALQTIQRISSKKKTPLVLVLLAGKKEWAKVLAEAEDVLSDIGLSIREEVTIHLIAARAGWQLALAAANFSTYELETPLSGAIGIDIEVARVTYRHGLECLRGLRELGWPPNVELIVEVAVASASVLGSFSEVLPLLREAADLRIDYPILQKNLALISIAAGRHEIALEANRRLPAHHEVLVLRTCLLYQCKQYEECVIAALEVLDGVDKAVKQTPMALALGSAAALKLNRTEDSKRLISGLTANSDWLEFVYIAESAKISLTDGSPGTLVARLRRGFEEFPESRVLAANLFSNLAVDQTSSASEIVYIAKSLRRFARLNCDESIHLIQAHSTLGQWQDAEFEARTAIEVFGKTGPFLSLLAVALEMQGKTGGAIAILEKANSQGHLKIQALRNYLGLCLRLGREASAQKTIEKLLSLINDRTDRIELTRLNALLLTQQGRYVQAYEVVRLLGGLVNAEVEEEEGTYLNVFMGTTLNSNVIISADDRDVFKKRVEDFCEKWPQSSLFRVATLPPNGFGSPDDLHNLLDGIVGDSRHQLKEFQAREQKARLGDFAVPFVARPGYVIHYIGDCFVLWEVAKKSKPEDRQFHLTMATVDEKQANRNLLRDIPMLDITALLVIRDLGLNDLLFSLFRRIAIPKRTVDYISQVARGLLVDPLTKETANSILVFVNANLERIDQAANGNVLARSVSASDALRDYVDLAKSGRWAVYSDDAFVRHWIRENSQELTLFSTINLLALADDERLLSAGIVAKHLSTLSEWNVGIVVASRYLIAALEGAVDETENLSASLTLDRYLEHRIFVCLARAIWYAGKSPVELIGHMGAVLAEMLANSNSKSESLVAVWVFWFNRVKYFRNFDGFGWRLLCYSLFVALRSLEGDHAARAISAYRTAIEVVVTPDLMTSEDEKRAISLLGQIAGEFAQKDNAFGESLRVKIARYFIAGTADGDLFAENYFVTLNGRII